MISSPDWMTVIMSVLSSIVTVSVALFFAYRGNLDKRLDKIDETLRRIEEKTGQISTAMSLELSLGSQVDDRIKKRLGEHGI